jgi:hypothetical protein
MFDGSTTLAPNAPVLSLSLPKIALAVLACLQRPVKEGDNFEDEVNDDDNDDDDNNAIDSAGNCMAAAAAAAAVATNQTALCTTTYANKTWFATVIWLLWVEPR